MPHTNIMHFLGPRWIKPFESAMIIVGVVGPFATLPQIIKLYFTHTQHASGQSLVTCSLYSILSLLWCLYGSVEMKPAIYLGNGISLVMNLLMVAGILIHAGMTF